MQTLSPAEITKKYEKVIAYEKFKEMSNYQALKELEAEGIDGTLTDKTIQLIVDNFDPQDYKMPPTLRPKYSDSQLHNKFLHDVDHYEVSVSSSRDIKLSWGWCMDCHRIRYQRVIGYDADFSSCYIKDFIDKGERVYEGAYYS